MDTSQNPCNEIPLNPGGFNKISIPLSAAFTRS
jgi:hypothetical protein